MLNLIRNDEVNLFIPIARLTKHWPYLLKAGSSHSNQSFSFDDEKYHVQGTRNQHLAWKMPVTIQYRFWIACPPPKRASPKERSPRRVMQKASERESRREKENPALTNRASPCLACCAHACGKRGTFEKARAACRRSLSLSAGAPPAPNYWRRAAAELLLVCCAFCLGRMALFCSGVLKNRSMRFGVYVSRTVRG